MPQTSTSPRPLVIEIAQAFAECMPTIIAIRDSEKAALQADTLDHTKIVSEICLFFHLARSIVATDRALNRKVKAFIGEAVGLTVTKERLAYINHMPSAVNILSLVLLCCKTYDIEADGILELELAVRSPAYLSFERIPFRYQEAVWLNEKITLNKIPERHDCSSALVFRATHPCVLKRDDLYAKTHSVMYESDFGATVMPTGGLSAGVLRGFRHDLYYCFCNADWDLVGEICMVYRYLRISDANCRRCEAALVSVFRKFGFIPSITFNAEFALKLDRDKINLYRFAHSYHSTLVLGILLACQYGDEECPPPNAAVPDDTTGVHVSDVLHSISRFFDSKDLELGPLNVNWYADDPTINAECLADGYATLCYKNFGKRAALLFLESMPSAGRSTLVNHTRSYISLV